LIAKGWNVEDTTGKGARGALPREAAEVEQIVGLFDTERGSGAIWTAEEFNMFAPRVLFRQWSEVPVGGALHLTMESGPVIKEL
jgi:hypothetical protein